ncbi:MAG: hypothetical protein RL367_2500 [Pseudomonadota bacterium]
MLATMLVIAFPRLIVIPHHADTPAYKRKPVFEIMRASRERLRQFPDHKFHKRIVIQRNS